ncbi:hypothetical protein GCM10028803_33410 [Larkinella knui]|uniref:Uncharacterized protein n=1 Tax=Larkinella knui TaxID=2025310 RepID=A0A3P1CYM5_9BACT|nr:hypothetical protein EHT87_08790 [Larkinella knui]
MWLYISLLSSHGEKFTVKLYSTEIEHQMELINQFFVADFKMISAFLIDREGKRTDLPLEAFDGKPIADSMNNLTTEYLQVLNS